MIDDVYPQEDIDREHSLRYINIKVRNVVGILNRIASLMRRKRYNMEEVSVSFEGTDIAYIFVAVDGRKVDVEQALNQIKKLHDVIGAKDVTHKTDQLYNAFYVDVPSKEALNDFPYPLVRAVPTKQGVKGVFMVSMEDTPELIKYILKNKYHYARRVISLL